MKRIAKWIGLAVGCPIGLLLLLPLLFYFPPFQRWAVKQATAYASEQTGMTVTIDRVRLAFPLDLAVEDVMALRPNDTLPAHTDTVAAISRVVADVRLLPLLQGKVYIDEFSLTDVRLNTGTLIASARVSGSVGKLLLRAHGIDLGRSLVRIDEAMLRNARLDVALSDTVPPDTTESSNEWKIQLDRLALHNTSLTLHMPGDTLLLMAHMGAASVADGYFDLGQGIYRTGKVEWHNGRLAYYDRFAPRVEGLDANHLSLTSLGLRIDSLYYDASRLSTRVSALRFKERCGLTLTHGSTTFTMDSVAVHIPDLHLRTTASELKAQLDMDMNAFDSISPGKLSASLHGSAGKHDLVCLAAGAVTDLDRRWPDEPLVVDASLRGNMQKAHLSDVRLRLPSFFELTADGFVGNLTDMDRLTAKVDVTATTRKQLAVVPGSVALPAGVSLKARVGVDGPRYDAVLTASERSGSLRGNVQFDAARMGYRAHLQADGFRLGGFLPTSGLGTLTGSVDVQGAGTDLLSPRTRLEAKVDIRQLSYQTYHFDKVTASVGLGGGRARLSLASANALIDGNLMYDGYTNGKVMKGTFACDLAHVDVRGLGLAKEPLDIGVCSHVDLETNFKDSHMIQGFVSDMVINDRGRVYRPEDLVLDVLATRDTTHAVADCGDFHLHADASGSYELLIKQMGRLVDEIQHQLHDNYIDQVRLRERLPMARICLNSGKENVVCRLLKRSGYELARVLMDMESSPVSGLNGRMQIDSLVVDSILLDTLRFAVVSDSLRTTYSAQIRNNKHNPDYTFNALFKGGIHERGAYLTTNVYDANDKLGLALGLSGAMEAEGVRVRIFGEDPILGYKRFEVNDSNYVFLGTDHRVSANLKLRAADGMGVQIYSDDDNTEVLQDLTVSLNKFDLEKILSVIPYTPNVAGMMNGDFHVVKTAEELSVSSAVDITNMFYERCPMGNIGSEFVYMPMDDGGHYVDGMLYHNGREVGTLQGTYQSAEEGYVDATFGMNRLPMELLNGFVPDRIIGLRGYGEGDFAIKGSLDRLQVDGELRMDSTYLFSEPYGVQMRFAEVPVKVAESKVLFDNFEMYASNGSPLAITGNFDFSDFNRMTMNLRMQARNFKLIDAKENPRSEAYGKAFVNFMALMTGPVDNLTMRGKIDVLGSTDMTYVMRDAELSADNQLNELVTFTNFRDSTEEVVERPVISGLDMRLSLVIAEAAGILCMLNAAHPTYNDLMGGGNLVMSYNPVDELTLTGRYTLSNGEMKYSLPIIPLKTFTIQDGSYIEFTGDPFNPRLNITATEHVKSAVDEGTGTGRVVDFDCGVKLTQTLSQLGLEFIIDAPNDMSISDQLKTMTVEGRSKVAITMLASGMYLTDGNTSSFSMNNALSSFLQSEINSVAGKAMQSMGLNLNMSVDNSTTASGGMHTDYNFSFSKRLWNNRLSVNLGGKVSTGSEVDMQRGDNANSFFNNVELQYRLDQYSSQYLRLFYDNNKYDWLEGYLGEYGVGFMWKRKVRHFKDIFTIGSRKKQAPAPKKESPKPTQDQ